MVFIMVDSHLNSSTSRAVAVVVVDFASVAAGGGGSSKSRRVQEEKLIYIHILHQIASILLYYQPAARNCSILYGVYHFKQENLTTTTSRI